MPTIYAHEIAAYRVDQQSIESEFREASGFEASRNLTHIALAVSNRANLLVIGLCGLVEARLFELAENVPGVFRLSDIRGQGISRLQHFLSRTEVVNFSQLSYWERFRKVYEIRNEIVHSYGGLVLEEANEKLLGALTSLELQSSLVGGRRIRLGPSELLILIGIIDGLLSELHAYAT